MSRNNSLLFLISLAISLSVLIFVLYGDIWPEPARRSDAALAVIVLMLLLIVLAAILLLVERAEKPRHRPVAKAGMCLVPIEQEEDENPEIKGKMPENFQQTL